MKLEEKLARACVDLQLLKGELYESKKKMNY